MSRLRGNTFGSYSVFQNILGLLTDEERSDSVDRPDARSSHPDVVLFWEEYHYSGKAVVEDRPDANK
jgi:hypothetical protein